MTATTTLTRTENGALQLRSSGSPCLDFFAEGVRAGDYYACKWLPHRHGCMHWCAVSSA